MQKLQSLMIALLLCVFPLLSSAEELPVWDGRGEVYVDSIPQLDFSRFPKTPSVVFSEYDSLGRTGAAYALLSSDLFPTSRRKSLQGLEPSGWQSKEYSFVPSGYLFNRSHLIANLFTGDDVQENLFTGTQFLNQETMFSIEESLYFYIDATNNSVRYAVIPAYVGEELVPRGIFIYAESVEDNAEGFFVCSYLHNVQPGVMIDYSDGSSAVAPVSFKKGDN